MVTASGTKDNLIKAASSGCDGFMVKPVKKDTLEEKMAAWGFEKKPEPEMNP
jgi:DNA-binding response OmpR family regulator